MIEFPSWIVVVSEVDMGSDFSSFQALEDLIGSIVDVPFLSFEGNGNYDDLHVGDSGRKDKTLVISVVHDHDTN